jgi:hypothetical protein
MTDGGRRRVFHGLAVLSLAAAGVACIRSAAADDAARLSFAEMYASRGVLGLELAPKTKALAGREVQILGYLAPPLKPDVPFFVLTRAPVALCPFCNSDADWPADIVVVYPRTGMRWTQDGMPVAVSGTLELGSKVDPQTGFVSQVRVVNADVRAVQ